MKQTLLGTPRDWWEMLNAEFNFQLDAAADDKHFMCKPYWTEKEDALTQDWTGRVWCSPPWHEPAMVRWVQKGFKEGQRGNLVVMLLPVRPQVEWWYDFVLKSEEIRFIRGCLAFEPFEIMTLPLHVEPHCLVIFSREGVFGGKTRAVSYPARPPEKEVEEDGR